MAYIYPAAAGDKNRDTSFVTSDMAYFEYGKMFWSRSDGQIETGGDFVIGNCVNMTPEDAEHILYMDSVEPIPNASTGLDKVGLYCVSTINETKDYIVFGKVKKVVKYALPYKHILWVVYQGRKSRGYDTAYIVCVVNKFAFSNKQVSNILKRLGNVKPFVRESK